jgi:hypothetical protein
MPIGKFKDFRALKAHLLGAPRMKIKDPDAYTAAVARKMEPNFDREAAAKRKHGGK